MNTVHEESPRPRRGGEAVIEFVDSLHAVVFSEESVLVTAEESPAGKYYLPLLLLDENADPARIAFSVQEETGVTVYAPDLGHTVLVPGLEGYAVLPVRAVEEYLSQVDDDLLWLTMDAVEDRLHPDDWKYIDLVDGSGFSQRGTW